MAWQQLSERLHERRLGYLGMYMVPGTYILNAYLPRYTRTSKAIVLKSHLVRILFNSQARDGRTTHQKFSPNKKSTTDHQAVLTRADATVREHNK